MLDCLTAEKMALEIQHKRRVHSFADLYTGGHKKSSTDIVQYHYCKSLLVTLPAVLLRATTCVKRLMTDVHSDAGLFLSKHFSFDVTFSLLHGNRIKNLDCRRDFLQSLLGLKRCSGGYSVQKNVSGTLIHKNVGLLLFPVGLRLSFSFQLVQ